MSDGILRTRVALLIPRDIIEKFAYAQRAAQDRRMAEDVQREIDERSPIKDAHKRDRPAYRSFATLECWWDQEAGHLTIDYPCGCETGVGIHGRAEAIAELRAIAEWLESLDG